MKKLFIMVALSLVMVACNKDEENELSYWDKVLNEMGETKLSAYEVLQSLRENECWETKSLSAYYQKDGKIIEKIVLGEGVLASGNPTALRFADDKMYEYIRTGPIKQYFVWDVEKTTEGIKYYEEGVLFGDWRIIGYDDNQILYESYPAIKQEPTDKGEYLYSKVLIVRKVDNTKWWEKAEKIN